MLSTARQVAWTRRILEEMSTEGVDWAVRSSAIHLASSLQRDPPAPPRQRMKTSSGAIKKLAKCQEREASIEDTNLLSGV